MIITEEPKMAKPGYTDRKQQILKRLSRVEGQVRGVSKMIQTDKYCIDVLTQISAARAALDRVAVELVRDHARHCLSDDSVASHKKGDKADELAEAIGRML